MAAWTPERIAALREHGAALRAMVADPAEQERQAAVYAGAQYQRQLRIQSEAIAEFDPYAQVDPGLDL